MQRFSTEVRYVYIPMVAGVLTLFSWGFLAQQNELNESANLSSTSKVVTLPPPQQIHKQLNPPQSGALPLPGLPGAPTAHQLAPGAQLPVYKNPRLEAYLWNPDLSLRTLSQKIRSIPVETPDSRTEAYGEIFDLIQGLKESHQEFSALFVEQMKALVQAEMKNPDTVRVEKSKYTKKEIHELEHLGSHVVIKGELHLRTTGPKFVAQLLLSQVATPESRDAIAKLAADKSLSAEVRQHAGFLLKKTLSN